jgi:hypothetical protein
MTVSIRIEHFDRNRAAQASQRSTDLQTIGYKVTRYDPGATVVAYNGDTEADESFTNLSNSIVLLAVR